MYLRSNNTRERVKRRHVLAGEGARIAGGGPCFVLDTSDNLIIERRAQLAFIVCRSVRRYLPDVIEMRKQAVVSLAPVGVPGMQKLRPLSAEIPELSEVLYFKSGVGQNVALHALSTASNSAFLICLFGLSNFKFFFFTNHQE